MEKNEKEALEAYRQERKERIAKQTKMMAKKSKSHQGAKSVAGKICGAIIAVVVVVAILAGSLNFFGVPQRLIKAVVIDGESYSMSELSCYYMQMYNNVYQTASSYESNYGEGTGKMLTGYDISLSPTAQTTKDEDGNEISWDEYLLEQAIESMATIKRYYNAAIEAGIEITEEAEQEIQETLDSYSAYLGNYSLSAFLSLQFGKGVTEKLFTQILREQQIVSIYQEAKQEELKSAYSTEDVEKIYSEDKSAYDVVGFRWFTIDVESDAEETTSAAEETSDVAETVLPEEREAQAFIERVKSEKNYNEDTFKKVVLEFADKESDTYSEYEKDAATYIQKINKESIETNVNEDAANWLYETDDSGNYVRQAGDMNYFLSSDKASVYILYAIGTPFKDETKPVSVRHILVKFPEESTAEPVSGEAVSGEAEENNATVAADIKAECESEAVSILDKYQSYIKENTSGAADEDYFGELASELSDDTGSQSTGGLIADMVNDGSYVPAFEDWAFTEGEFAGEERVAGSTGIIETEYGYHVMYYVGANDNPNWYESILTDLVSEKWEEEQTAFEEEFGEDAIVRKEKIEAWVKNACIETIEMNLAY